MSAAPAARVHMGHHDGQHHVAGLGIGPVTMQRMCEILLEAYNDPRTEDDYRFIIVQHSRIPAEALEQALNRGQSFREIYEATLELVNPYFHIGDQVPDQITPTQWLNSGAGIQGQGIMLDTRALLQHLLDGM